MRRRKSEKGEGEGGGEVSLKKLCECACVCFVSFLKVVIASFLSGVCFFKVTWSLLFGEQFLIHVVISVMPLQLRL